MNYNINSSGIYDVNSYNLISNNATILSSLNVGGAIIGPNTISSSSNRVYLYGGENFLSPLASKICLHRTGTLTWKGIGHGLYCVEYV